MSTQKFVQTPAITLYTGMSAAATSCIVTPYPRDIQTNTKLTITDFGDTPNFTVDPKIPGIQEICTFTGITDNGDNTATLTGLVRNLIGQSPYVTPGTGKQHGSSAVVVFSDNPQMFARLASKENANTFTNLNIFSGYAPQTDVDPVSANDLTRLSYVQALVLGTLTTINVIVPGTAGATISAGQSIYFDDASNQWKLTDATSSSTMDDVLLGIAQGSGTAGNPIANGVLLQGVDTHQTGLTDGQTMYASNTPGAISNSAGTISVVLGISKGTTQLYFSPRFNQQITANQLAALAGNGGTPSASNLYVTQKGVQIGAETYAADAQASDTYVITLSPAPSAYVAGMQLRFKANTVNTGPATLNVNGLGAKTIVKGVSTALADGDIAAGMILTVVYDGTNFVLQVPTNNSTAAVSKILVVTTAVVTTSTTADILTAPIPANTLGSNGGVYGRIYFTWRSQTTTVKQILLKYGATTLATIAMTPDAGTDTTFRGSIDFTLLANNATGAQEGNISVLGLANGAGVFRTTAVANLIPMEDFQTGTSVQDSTGALNLVISIAQNASTNDTFTMVNGWVKNI